ncbi:HET-domain-containing protein [Teratosphaeria nubilosa]|uniref:HET-domain-containing protein n=1 Tax=Teratosphaeria nubilosa TaxID=161662 RepID=A0A6G1KV72_9PEZI|nr:HET-domain-containing protein [Teratosphaeria nubilosa]
MRLLHTETYTFNEYLDPETTQYAILSHRWNTSGSEVLYHELKDIASHPELFASSRFDKIKMACATARHRTQPLEWIWIDPCCIDKTNNVELAEALNSMYTWYRQATLCLAYLFDVNLYAGTNAGEPTLRTGDASQYSEWFSRGWTLQELLAPRQMMFYDRYWTPIGTKDGLASELRIATGGIHEDFLTGASDVRTASAAMKLSWACGRTTTRREGRVYSLLGLLNVPLSPFYGEGEKKAFWRLQQKFCKQSRDESIFAWTLPPRKGDAADNPVPPGWRDDERGNKTIFAFPRSISFTSQHTGYISLSVNRPPSAID